MKASGVLHNTVEPLYNSHTGGRVYWPLWRGGHCLEVKIRINLSTGAKICGRCREVVDGRLTLAERTQDLEGVA